MPKSLRRLIRNQLAPAEEPSDESKVKDIFCLMKFEKNGKDFWRAVEKVPLYSDRTSAWKFCILLHRLMRVAHMKFVTEAFDKSATLHSLSEQWRVCENSLGPCVAAYSSALVHKLAFQNNYQMFDGCYQQIKNTNVGTDLCFQVCVDCLELLAIYLHLQYVVLDEIRAVKVPISSKPGIFRINALNNIIKEICDLYGLINVSMYELAGMIAPNDFEGIHTRYFALFHEVKVAFENLNSFTWILQFVAIPNFPNEFPNFCQDESLDQINRMEPTAPPEF